MFGFACSCPGDESPTTTFAPTTTTMLATTTPPKEYCYYTASRPAQLPSSRKRLYNPSPIAQECQYPGVVGLFQSTDLSAVCNGILLEEDVILVAEFCLNHINTFDVHAHVTSYQASDANINEPKAIGSTATQLDSVGIYDELYTVQLDSPVTFDSQCAQPACVPNSQIVATDIDFNDCRLVGYGLKSNDFGDTSAELSEILVTVDSASITEKELVVSRVDGDAGQACFNDDTAPLICSRKETGEWITVGATTSIGFPCSSPEFSPVKVANLLNEATIKLYYNGLQRFKYAEPA